ncbi:MAG: hypothetical protein FWD71_16715 [Oscillospiraceae bacterium]|nr:hypothetical protein [Oscillospiraceae bacterium]
MFIFKYVIKNSEHEIVTKMRESRKKFNADKNYESIHNNFMKRFFVTIILIVIIIVVSILLKFSAYVLLGLPVLFSAVNLIFERQYDRRDNPDEDKENNGNTD